MSDVIDLAADREAALDRTVRTLREGGLAVLPTESAYAVCADAFAPVATRRIFAARRRPRTVPLPVLIRSPRQVSGLVREVPEPADRLMSSYWPGLLTLILPQTEGLTWDLGDTRGTLQLRLPADDFLIEVITEVGPLAVTSANRMAQPRPRTVAAAQEQLGVLVPLYIDGGEREGPLSTIVDVTRGKAEIRRQGAVSREDVLKVAAGEVGWGERPAPAEEPAAEDVAEAEAPPTEEPAAEDVAEAEAPPAEEAP